jgi:hypothetical protein
MDSTMYAGDLTEADIGKDATFTVGGVATGGIVTAVEHLGVLPWVTVTAGGVRFSLPVGKPVTLSVSGARVLTS